MTFNDDTRNKYSQVADETVMTEESPAFVHTLKSSAKTAIKPVRLKRRLVHKPLPTITKRQMSSIAFPYVDLEAVIAVARAMNDVGGLALTRDQLAGALRQSPTSGAFILKMSAARQFGLVELVQGNKYQLTQLGFAIVGKDETQERSARAAAFLNVPLYRKAYDEFRGRPLPPRPIGLESAFVQFGVGAKQKDTARQIFDKSARQAGFLSVDPDRLIEPVTIPPAFNERVYSENPIIPSIASIPSESGHKLDPLIQGLVDRLPTAGTIWELEKRARWLQTLAANFDMVYETQAGGVIIIEVKKGSNSE